MGTFTQLSFHRAHNLSNSNWNSFDNLISKFQQGYTQLSEMTTSTPGDTTYSAQKRTPQQKK